MQNNAVVYSECNTLFVYQQIMGFGDWLRDQMKRTGMHQAEVARRPGYSPTYIGHLQRDFNPNTKDGKGRPSEKAVAAIAKALSADPDEARIAAGYAPLNEIPVLFYNEGALTDDDREIVQQLINSLAQKRDK